MRLAAGVAALLVVVGVGAAIGEASPSDSRVGAPLDAAARALQALSVDSFAQQGVKLTGRGEQGNGDFGYSVALSRDGDVALVGGPNDDHGGDGVGAVWVFARSGSTWRQQAELSAHGGNGRAGFGASVALSADGDTALIGADQADGGRGAAWVFTRSGSAWTQQSALTGSSEVGQGTFGWSVALSANGERALIGGPDDNGERGAVWEFERTGLTWRQLGKGIGGTRFGDELGSSVALSSNGATALVGSDGADDSAGAVWVLRGSGSNWAAKAQKVTGSHETAGYGRFGWTVALSGSGDVALVGSYSPYTAVWALTRSGSGWRQQILSGNGESGAGGYGESVALSNDGDTALVGGHEAAWIYSRSGATWSGARSKVSGSGQIRGGTFWSGWFGTSVALSGDGTTALVGSPGDHAYRGAAWLFRRASGG